MNNGNYKFCQSCGMPMGGDNSSYGYEKDGSKSKEYCKYCYTDGKFTFNGTIEEMINICVQPMVDNNHGMTQEIAKDMLNKFLPTLKR